MKIKFLIPFFVMQFFFSATHSQIIFSESFSTGILPSGWTNDSSGMSAMNLWLFDNPYNRTISGVSFLILILQYLIQMKEE